MTFWVLRQRRKYQRRDFADGVNDKWSEVSFYGEDGYYHGIAAFPIEQQCIEYKEEYDKRVLNWYSKSRAPNAASLQVVTKIFKVDEVPDLVQPNYYIKKNEVLI